MKKATKKTAKKAVKKAPKRTRKHRAVFSRRLTKKDKEMIAKRNRMTMWEGFVRAALESGSSPQNAAVAADRTLQLMEERFSFDDLYIC